MDSLRLYMKFICWERFLLELTSSRTVDDLEAIWQRSVETGQSLMKSIFLGFYQGDEESLEFPPALKFPDKGPF